jgi:hypothetical protein
MYSKKYSPKIHGPCQTSWHNLLRVDKTLSEKLKQHMALNSLPCQCHPQLLLQRLHPYCTSISNWPPIKHLSACGNSQTLISTMDVMTASFCCCYLLVVIICSTTSFVLHLLLDFVCCWHSQVVSVCIIHSFSFFIIVFHSSSPFLAWILLSKSIHYNYTIFVTFLGVWPQTPLNAIICSYDTAGWISFFPHHQYLILLTREKITQQQ